MLNKKKKSQFLASFSSQRPKWFWIVLIVVFFLLLNATPLAKTLRGWFYSVSEPLQGFLWDQSLEGTRIAQVLLNMEKLKEENETLKKENQVLIQEKAIFLEQKEENEELRKALDLELNEEFNLSFVDVIGRDIGGSSLLINKGSHDGFSFGLPVITAEKALVGRISEVYESYSKVELITSEEHCFDGEVIDRDTFGLVKGKGGLNLVFELIPRDEEINPGDQIITSSVGRNFPEGLLVGKVRSIERSDVKSFQEAEIVPSFELFQLEHLFVITNF